MFDISLVELGMISAVALLVLGPQEFTKAVKFIKQAIHIARNWWKRHSLSVDEIMGETQADSRKIVNYIMDLDGNMQPTYDLSAIMPNIKPKRMQSIAKKNKQRLNDSKKAKSTGTTN